LSEEISASQLDSHHYVPKERCLGYFGAKYLTSYGPVVYENYHLLDPGLKSWLTSDDYFYFGAWNLQHGKVEGMTEEWDMSDFAFVHNGTSKIYSNGLTEIYYGK
jgi:hypothetical protein